MIKENFINIYKESFVNNWELPGLSDYSEKQTLYYKDLAREIAKIHLLLEELDVQKGDKIALIGKNNIPWCTVYLATFTYGAVIVPILQDFHPSSVQHIVEHSEAKFLFSDQSTFDKLDVKAIPSVNAIFSVESFGLECFYSTNLKKDDEIIASLDDKMTERYPNGYRKEDIKYAEVDNSELVLLNYTSGTTGFSKGVMLSANNLAGNITHAHYLKLLFKSENMLSFLPLAHAYGCAFEFLYALSTGVHVTLLGKPPVPKILLDAFADLHPPLIISVPLIIEKIYKSAILPKISKPSMKVLLKIPGINTIIYKKIKESLINVMGGNVRQVIIGGAALNPEVEAFLYKIKFPFTVGYGMTECAPLISYNHHYDFVPTSCGRILDDIMEIRIDSADPYNIGGEIQVRGENVMMGYYKNEEDTKNVFTDDGWLRTGDLGTIDETNRIFIRGRIKTMLLGPSGQNIFPEEIEARMNNLKYISESLVVQRSGKLVALIFPDEEAMKADAIETEQLASIYEEYRKQLNPLLANYEKVTSIEIRTEEFEKTPKKSIKRFLYS